MRTATFTALAALALLTAGCDEPTSAGFADDAVMDEARFPFSKPLWQFAAGLEGETFGSEDEPDANGVPLPGFDAFSTAGHVWIVLDGADVAVVRDGNVGRIISASDLALREAGQTHGSIADYILRNQPNDVFVLDHDGDGYDDVVMRESDGTAWIEWIGFGPISGTYEPL